MHDNVTIPSTVNSQQLKCFHINIRSVFPKMDELRHTIHQYDIDCLSINESMLDNTIHDSEVNINIILNGTFSTECVWVKVKAKNQYNILIGSLYRPPSAPVVYYDNIINDLEFVSSFNYDIILMGDINYNCYDVTKNEYIPHTKIRTLEAMFQLSQIIREPTRISSSASTLIDIVLCSDSLQPISSQVLNISLSDHYALFVTFPFTKNKKTAKIIKRRNFNKFVYSNFISDLHSSIILNMIYNQTNTLEAWTAWKNEFLSICQKHAPIQTCKVKCIFKPWFSKELQNMIYSRNHAHKLFAKNKDIISYNKYKELRNKVTSKIRKEKFIYYSDQIENNKNNISGMWNTLKHLLPSKNKYSSVDENLDPNEFNCFFSNIGQKLTSSFNEPQMNDFTVPSCDNEFEFYELNVNFTLKELLKLPLKPSLDVLNFDHKLLHLSAPAIAPSLSHIFNLSLHHGTIPDDWKTARITPIYKNKGSKDDPNNYRPISVVSTIAKILEKPIKCNNCLKKQTVANVYSFIDIIKYFSKDCHNFCCFNLKF